MTMVDTAAARPKTAARVAHLLRLALPTVVARAGILTIWVADFVMIGRDDADSVGPYALALSLFIPIVVSSIGVMLGALVLTSRHIGAGRPRAALLVFRRALPWSVTLGVVGSLALLAAPAFLAAIGQSPELADRAGAIAWWLAPAVLFQLVYVAMTFFVEGAQNPRPAMVVMVLANVLNVALNAWLIGGGLGVEPLGAEGAAIATTIVRIFFVVGMVVYLWRSNFLGARVALLGALRGFARPRLFWGPGGFRAGRDMRRLGLAAGASLFFETVAYGVLQQAAGRIGEPDLGAFAIVYNIEAVCFMIALGVATATGVLVSAAVGAGDRLEARAAAATGVALVAAAMTGVVVALTINAENVVRFYVQEVDAVARSAALLAVAGAWIFADALQLTISHAARGAGEAWSLAARHAVAYFAIMLPCAFSLVFVFGWSAEGLVAGATIGCLTSVALAGFLLRRRLRSAA